MPVDVSNLTLIKREVGEIIKTGDIGIDQNTYQYEYVTDNEVGGEVIEGNYIYMVVP